MSWLIVTTLPATGRAPVAADTRAMDSLAAVNNLARLAAAQRDHGRLRVLLLFRLFQRFLYAGFMDNKENI